MANIDIKLNSVKSINSKLTHYTSDLADVKSKVLSLKSNLDREIVSRQNIGGRLTTAYSSLSQLENELREIHKFVDFSVVRYEQAENRVEKLSSQLKKVKDQTNAIVDFLSNAWDDATDWAEAAWDRTTDVAEDVWKNTTDFFETAWDATTDFASDTWDNATELAGTAWDATTDWVGKAWNATTDAVEAAWDKTVDYFSKIKWGDLLDGTLNILDGIGEILLGVTVATASGAAAIFTGGTATPLAIAGLIGSGYLFVDGINKVVTGFGQMTDTFYKPDEYNIGSPTDDGKKQIPNVIEEAHEWALDPILGEGSGEFLYNGEQFIISAISVEKAATDVIRAVKNMPQEELLNKLKPEQLKEIITNMNPKDVWDRYGNIRDVQGIIKMIKEDFPEYINTALGN